MSAKVNGFQGHLKMSEKFEEIRIPVPWGHISGKWWGSKNKQPVLAIHGWQDNSSSFDNLAPLLVKEDISLLCIDLPGHGLSSHFPKGQFYYVFWDGILFVRRIVKYFKWKKVTLLGHSLGGAISFLYAAVFPDDVEKYISIDIVSPTVKEPAKAISSIGECVDRFLKYETLSKEQIPCYDYDEMIDLVKDAYKDSVTRESCEVLMNRGMKPAPYGEGFHFTRDVRLKVSVLGFMTLDQVLEFACRIRCEVLNIRGDPGMSFDKPEYYDLVLKKIREHSKRLDYHVVPGTHHMHLNDPQNVAGLISDFLNS